MSEPECAVCGHAEAFHGVSDKSKGALFDGVEYCRYEQVQDGPDSYMITCHCGHYEPMMEESDVDRPSIPSQPGPAAAERPAGVPGGRVTTIHDVDCAWDGFVDACERYTSRRGARA